MKTIYTLIACLLLTGCQTYAPTNSVRTVAFNPRLEREAILEATVNAARDSGLPAMTKMDKANGIVEFGGFGNPELGLAAQARIRADNNVEITVKRGSVFVPLKGDSQAEVFKAKLAGRLAELQAKAQ